MMSLRRSFFAAVALLLAAAAFAGEKEQPDPNTAYTNAKDAGPDYDLQGEYMGAVKTPDGEIKVGMQVIALGGGKFRAVGYHGGLPGDGWNGGERPIENGESKDGVATFRTEEGAEGTLKDGVVTIEDKDGNEIAQLKKVERTSPTLGAKPPEGAIVLFDGKNTEAFEGGGVEDGLLVPQVTSKQKFGDCTLHLEFQLPFMPYASGQARGNSGCYLQGRYEVQILDSFGLEGKNNECGGIYSVKDPDVNMCLPPLAWQTYDIDYTAARYEGDKKVKNARMTVKHNGVVVHKDAEIPNGTTAHPVPEGPNPGPIYLQDHGNPVRFRNIWVVEK